MCGILGQISLNNNKTNFSKKKFKDALKLLKHRGPDYSDIFKSDSFIFGHRRLSILDLNNSAKQPMVSECRKYVITFNGEIYNYQEIKKKLIKKGYKFKTSGDTEVLLNSFIDKGIDCLKDFIGMFAFTVFDGIKNEFFIVRDRIGIKPLYYSTNKNNLIFSSEIKSILELDRKKRKLNIDAISSYLSFRYPILNDTFFENIVSLPPGHFIKISNGKKTLHEYWNVSEKFKEQNNDKGEEYYISQIKKILESSVKYRMISDVPFGAFLSGGVDSSIITALMAKNQEKPIKTFTIGFNEDGFNEFEYAAKIATKYKTDHKEIILSGKDYIKTMEKLIKYKDAPLSVPNEVPLYLMSKELKKFITVVLSGEGADEIFCGYGRIFKSPYDLERIKNIDNLKLSSKEKQELCENFIKKYGVSTFKNEIEHFMNIYSYTSFNEKKSLLNDSIDLTRVEEKLTKKFLKFFNELKDESYYNKIIYAFEKVHILGLLHRLDTTTMATSVEARVPFVDHRLVEFALTTPIKYKLKWHNENEVKKSKTLMSDEISEKYDTPKYILKKAFEDMIPNQILYRKKMGFPVPLNNWFGGNFNKYVSKILLSKMAKKRKLYNTENINKWLNNDFLKKNNNFALKIWMLVNIELFLKKYFK